MKKQIRRGRWLRRLARIVTTVILLFIIACFIFDQRVQFRKSDEALQATFSQYNIPGTIGYYTSGGRRLRFMRAGSDSLATLLFLHGSPGSMSYYSRRFADSTISSRFQMIAVDRPGYGYSGLGNAEPSIYKQSEMIRPLLDSLHKVSRPIIIVGSSYGAPIACRLAMDHPELVDGLVLTGPSLGPGLETYFWFTHIIESPVINWVIPRIFRSANTEKVHHKKELEAMLPLWKNIRVPVAYVQGVDDDIIDTSNASFARKHLVNVPYFDVQFIKGREHRLAQFEWPVFRETILRVYEEAKKQRLSPQ